MRLERDTLSLPAIAPSWFREVTGDPFLLADMAHAVGGPFHVLFPQEFARNLRAFTQAISSAGVSGRVLFAKKANKAGAWLQVCAGAGAGAGAGVDVASAEELVHALARGVRGIDLVVTGPVKSERLLWLATRHDCLVAIDALDELDRLLALVLDGERVRILLRVLPEVNPDSRFGFDPAELDIAVSRCVEQRNRVSMEGFSFHLSGYEVQPRAQLADRLLDRLIEARAQGLAATSLSIGGGFAVSYFEAETWARFLRNGHEADFHAGKKFAQLYPYYQSPTGADMLAAILASETGCNSKTVGGKFIKTGTKLLVEPGRALLDRAGFTVFPVEGFKRRGDYGITTVRGLSMSLSEQWKSSEFLPDPILWPVKGLDEGHSAGPVLSCVGGASCLEYDMLSWRKVVLPREPRHDDLLIYPNTAGYQMDKNESEFHGLRVPPKTVVTLDDLGNFRWQLDENGYQL